MAISQVILMLLLWAVAVFICCLLIGCRHNKIENWMLAGETFTLLAALCGGVVISHIFSEQQESLSQTSYRSALNFAYETNLDCRHALPFKYSPAIADACKVIDAAFRDSFAPMPERGPEYWQRNMKNVENQLKLIGDRPPPRESITSAVDKEIIGIAIRSLHADEQYPPTPPSSSWNHRFWEAFITALIVTGTATLKLYIALIRRNPSQIQAFAKYLTSFTFSNKNS